MQNSNEGRVHDKGAAQQADDLDDVEFCGQLSDSGRVAVELVAHDGLGKFQLTEVDRVVDDLRLFGRVDQVETDHPIEQ